MHVYLLFLHGGSLCEGYEVVLAVCRISRARMVILGLSLICLNVYYMWPSGQDRSHNDRGEQSVEYDGGPTSNGARDSSDQALDGCQNTGRPVKD